MGMPAADHRPPRSPRPWVRVTGQEMPAWGHAALPGPSWVLVAEGKDGCSPASVAARQDTPGRRSGPGWVASAGCVGRSHGPGCTPEGRAPGWGGATVSAPRLQPGVCGVPPSQGCALVPRAERHLQQCQRARSCTHVHVRNPGLPAVSGRGVGAGVAGAPLGRPRDTTHSRPVPSAGSTPPSRPQSSARATRMTSTPSTASTATCTPASSVSHAASRSWTPSCGSSPRAPRSTR